MSTLRAGIVAAALGAGFAGLLAEDATIIGTARLVAATNPAHATWEEINWPFPLDQWAEGRAFRCRAPSCGAGITLYLRAKLGFCNCTTGVADDADLDRVSDLELFGDTFEGLADGQQITIHRLRGRSRPYQVAIPDAPPRTALAIAFNDNCDVIVATVVAGRKSLLEAERIALDFLNGDLVLRWAEAELGL